MADVDYEGLAKKFGGQVVDYEALAKQFGGAAVEKPASGMLVDTLEAIRRGGIPGAMGAWGANAINRAATAAGEFVNDQSAKVLPAPAAAALGAGANAAIELGPMVLGGGAVGATAAPLMERGARGLMKSAVKPTLEMQRSGKANRAITTMLEDGYSPTQGGVDAMKTKIYELGDEVKAVTDGSTQTVSKYDIGQKMNDLLREVEKGTLGRDATAAVLRVWDEFLSHPLLTGKADIPVKVMQEMKQANYKAMGDAAYGLGLKPAAERDALKTLTSGIKEGIEKAEPGVVAANAKMTELLNAKKVAERRVMMSGNRNPVSLPTSVAAVAHDPVAALGLWANSSDFAKSGLARLMYSGSEAIPASTGALTGGVLAELIRRHEERQAR